MCEIYSNAHLVISADASPSSHFGFLPGRDHVEKQWRPITISDAVSGHRLLTSARTHRANTRIRYNGSAWDGKSEDPLLQRGWALQESLLANRLLRFTASGMQWECNYMNKGWMGLMSRAIRIAKLTRLYPTLRSRLPQDEIGAVYDEKEAHHIIDFMNRNTPATVHHAWLDIVAHYSARDLTKIADKLSALSGLARLVSQALNARPDDYIAGHWKTDMANSLLWYVGQPKAPNRSSQYRAPSWSWASINGHVEYFLERYQFRFSDALTVQSTHALTLNPLDTFGRVRSASICVTGLVVDVALHTSPCAMHSLYYNENEQIGPNRRVFPDQYSWVSIPGESGLSSRDGRTAYYEVLLDDVMPAESIDSSRFRCLLVGRHEDRRISMRALLRPPSSRWWWLVLRRTLIEGNECWERIGIGWSCGSTSVDDSEYFELFATGGERVEMITLV